MPRKAVIALLVVVAAIVGVAVVVTVLAARDDATVSESTGPGVERPENSRPVVRAGNVVLLYSDERLTRRLRELATEIGGPPDDTLIAAGQAVVVQRKAGLRVAVVAVSAGHRVNSTGPDDPALRAFVEYWLGREPTS
ncbi:MAG TPA: hypothetical protein VMY78_06635 [Solirubrobacteraceae bacterium]|nr:hypothetical protein [Solirubrobacteraceae bacterium]